jgi:hypothetical protein
METKPFLQGIASFILFILAIIVFKLIGLDVSFIVTIILAIFSTGISIFFFIETNHLFDKLSDKLTGIEKGIYNLQANPRIKNLRIKGDTPTWSLLQRVKHLNNSDTKYNWRKRE